MPPSPLVDRPKRDDMTPVSWEGQRGHPGSESEGKSLSRSGPYSVCV